MAFYFLLLRLWLNLGDGEVVLRAFSVATGVATVPLVYILGKRLFDARTGLVAALLLALNTFNIQYSEEVRAYSLLTLLVGVSAFFWVGAVQRSSWKSWSGYTVSVILAFFTHFFAAIVPVAFTLSLLFFPWRQIPWKGLISSSVVIGLVLGMPAFLLRVSGLLGFNDLNVLPGVRQVSSERLLDLARLLSGGGGDLLLVCFLIPLAVSLVVAIRTWLSLGRSFESWKYSFLIMFFLVPLFVSLAISIWVHPILNYRYVIFCLIPLVVLVASGIMRLGFPSDLRNPTYTGSNAMSIGILFALVALNSAAVYSYHRDFQREDWRGATSLVVSNWQADDRILFFIPRTARFFYYYTHQSGAQQSRIRLLAPAREWNRFVYRSETAPDREAIAEFLPDHPSRVWLVLARDGRSARQGTRDEIIAALDTTYPYSESWELPKIRVFLFSRTQLPEGSGIQTTPGGQLGAGPP
jgi:uncharacterized membrane protein